MTALWRFHIDRVTPELLFDSGCTVRWPHLTTQHIAHAIPTLPHRPIQMFALAVL